MDLHVNEESYTGTPAVPSSRLMFRPCAPDGPKKLYFASYNRIDDDDGAIETVRALDITLLARWRQYPFAGDSRQTILSVGTILM